MVGLDRAQFIDEQIGERGLLDDLCGSPSPAGASVNEGVVVGLEKR